MAAKRMVHGDDQSSEKKRPRGSSSSIPNDMREVLFIKSLKNNIGSDLEPFFRRVVNEEVERGIRRRVSSLQRRNSFRSQELTGAPKLRLSFKQKLTLPIYTNSNIEAHDKNPLEIVIEDSQTGNRIFQGLPASLRIEILVLNADFPHSGGENWNSEEFSNNLVRQRDGKRPLLTGDVNIIMRDGVGLIRDLAFTDNSSWIRSRKFRLGARVIKDNAVVTIGEAISEAFVVKDHRGESYKKHHPPSPNDEVWRLEKIIKDGVFHKRLAAEGINIVQDFLRLSIMDQALLRKILGPGMSDRMWEVAIEHAKTCILGDKLYFHHDNDKRYLVVFNSICQTVAVFYDGYQLQMNELSGLQKAQVAQLVDDAYHNWAKLKEVNGESHDNNVPMSPSKLGVTLATESLSATTSSQPRTINQLESPDQEEGPSFSTARQETQFQNDTGLAYFSMNEHEDMNSWLFHMQNSVDLSRNIEDHHLQNLYHIQ